MLNASSSHFDPNRSYAAQNSALRSRPPVQAPLSISAWRLYSFGASSVILNVVRGAPLEASARRYIDCVGGRPGKPTDGAAMKMRHCKTTKLKRRNESTTARGRGPSSADVQEQLDRLTRELAEAR